MNARTIDTERDGIETAIILALEAREKSRVSVKVTKGKAKSLDRVETGAEIFCPRTPEFPKDMLAFDLSDEDRVFTASLDDLVVSPEKAIGRRLEVGMLCTDGTFKWTCIKPMPSPRGLVALTNRPVSWYAWHYREVKEGKRDVYVRRPLALCDGRVPLMKPLAWKGYDPKREQRELGEQLALMLSVFEDTNRAGSIQATVEESARITFPLADDAYQSFFRLRDGLKNTPTGRRNPILHWCRRHLRRTQSGRSTQVAGHDRGTVDLVHGNMRLTLRRSDGYGAFLEQNGTGT